MLKQIYFVSIAALCIACNSSTDTAKENEQTKQQLSKTAPASLESFADSLVRLDKYEPENIEKAAYYFQQLVPSDSALADSAAVLFLNFAWSISDTTNQKLLKDTTDYMDLVYPGGNSPTEKQKAFQQSMKRNHLNIQGNGEGDVLAVLDYKWLNNILQPKTSSAVDDYLSLLATEETEPALQDAALAVEIKELISRLILTEALSAQQLPANFADNNRKKNKFYIDVLLLGSNNTPSLEEEASMKLTTEFKQGYDYLLAAYPASKAAEKLKEWLAILKAKDRKKIEEMRASAFQE